MQIKEALTKDVKFALRDTPLSEVAKMMKEVPCGSIPVGEGEKLVGMVTDRDIVVRCIAEGRNPSEVRAEECMSPRILYCHDTDEVETVIENMGQNAVRRLPVINKDRKLVGIVSLGDLATVCDNKAAPGIALCTIATRTPGGEQKGDCTS